MTPESPSPIESAQRDAIVELRRRLHRQPELSGDEAQTAALVTRHLRRLDVRTETGIGGYGVVGILEGGQAGSTIAYRADMDALPMQDSLDTAYASQHLAIKHACGHDAHTAIALGIAMQLSRIREELPGRVAFVFQPAEESLDGARAMLDDGLFELVKPDAMLALHVAPLPVGTVGIAEGPCLAGMEEFRVRFYAPAGNLEDLVAAASASLTALSTAAVPEDAASFSRVVAAMMRGDPQLAGTVLVSCWPEPPGQVPEPRTHLLGLLSITDFARRPQIHSAIDRALGQAVAKFGAAYDLEYTFSNPPLRNDPALVARVAPILESRLGREQVLRFKGPYPFAHEDFTHYAAEIPALFLWLGTQNLEKGITSILHTPDYDIDETALAIGVETMSTVIRELLAGITSPPLQRSPRPPDTAPTAPPA
ncbi:MAG: amidohydrolase [Anaerolineae bacterium]|nr:amidohydrolase [Anaerolineae bacterium]